MTMFKRLSCLGASQFHKAMADSIIDGQLPKSAYTDVIAKEKIDYQAIP